jgi:tetratricopeptide (TPR) repeat protein
MPSYLSYLKLLEKKGEMLLCEYCGFQTPAIGNSGICSNCEMQVSYSDAALKSIKPSVYSHAQNIYNFVSAKRFDNARKECDAAYQETADLGYIYCKGLISIKASNSAQASIRYDRQGFMEENSVFRNAATKEAAAARGYFNSIISTTKMAGKDDSIPYYLIFLSNIKLHNIKEASETLKAIKSRNIPLLENYGNMILQLNSNSPESTILAAKKLLSEELFSINALYYIAEALADMGDYKKSIKLALALLEKLPKQQINRLIWRINSASSI